MSAVPALKPSLKISIKIISGPHAGLALNSDLSEVLIGRSSDCQVSLPDDVRVSRQHAQLRISSDEVWVTNMSKKNFVLINGVQSENARIRSGDKIQVGESEFIVQFESPSPGVSSAKAQAVNSQAMGSSSNPPSAVSLVKQGPPATAVRPSGVVTPHSTGAIAPHSTGSIAPHAASGPAANYNHGIPSSPPHYQNVAQAQAGLRAGVSSSADEQAKRFRFILLVVAVIGFGAWLFLGSSSKKAEVAPFRSSTQIEQDRLMAEKSKELLKERKEKMDTLQAKRAQENYIKGFRDFRQGQYARARDSFQVVLNLDPENALALQYYRLSQIKFDEQVKFTFIQGQRYREKKNFRMCASAFGQVMTMLQGQRESQTYKEAKLYFEECSLAKEGRF